MARRAVIEKAMLQSGSAAVHHLSSLSGKGRISPRFLSLGSTPVQAATLSMIHLPESRNPTRRCSVVLFTACIRSAWMFSTLDQVLVNVTSGEH